MVYLEFEQESKEIFKVVKRIQALLESEQHTQPRLTFSRTPTQKIGWDISASAPSLEEAEQQVVASDRRLKTYNEDELADLLEEQNKGRMPAAKYYKQLGVFRAKRNSTR